MLEFVEASKFYPTNHGVVRALDGLTLRIEAGEFVAVRGQSGAGKSTLLALGGGLATPSEGSVLVDGQNLADLLSAERAELRATKIGFVFQMFHLLPYLSVLDNVRMASRAPSAQARRAAEETLHRFGLSDRLTHVPGQLSAGERQRVAMARAMLNEPKLLLADEPTGNLDAENASAVLDLISEFHAGGGTVLLVTHDDRAAAYAQRAFHLNRGKLVPEATPEPVGAE